MINEHSCPFKPCTKFFEMDDDLTKHINDTHSTDEKQNCHLCHTHVQQTHLDGHLAKAHVKCIVCNVYFKNYTELSEHNSPTPCNTVTPAPPKTPNPPGAYLTPQTKTDIDVFRTAMPDPTAELVSTLSLMCSAIPDIPQKLKAELMTSIANYGALGKHTSHLEKYPHLKFKMKRTILEPPSFNHQGKESLSKVSDFLGTQLPIWSPGHKPGDQMTNFLTLQKLHNDVSFATSACYLREGSAVAVLLKHISKKTCSDLEAYTFSPPEKTSYASILKAAQDVFFANLSLEDIAFEAETLQKMPHEKFHEFTLRAYNLLSLSSLGRDEIEKQTYIETNLRRLSLAALPAAQRLKIETLETTHGITYNCKDIADFLTQENIDATPTTLAAEHATHLFAVSRQDVTNCLTDSSQSDNDDEEDDDCDDAEHFDDDSYNPTMPNAQGDNIFKCAALLPKAQPCNFLATNEKEMREHLTHTHRTSKFMALQYTRATSPTDF